MIMVFRCAIQKVLCLTPPREVAANGLTQEAQECAAGALQALGARERVEHVVVDEGSRHIMMSYQWDGKMTRRLDVIALAVSLT